PFTGDFAKNAGGMKETITLVFTAADPPTELVKLSQAKTLCALNIHDRSVRYVNADFNDRGRNEHIRLSFGKRAHHAVFLLCLHAAMQHRDAVAFKRSSHKLLVHFMD